MKVMPSTDFSSSIHAVLFDYGLVLSGPPTPAAWEKLRAVLDVDGKKLFEAYWRWRDDYDRGVLNAPSYWATVARAVDRELDMEKLRALVDADTDVWTQPNEEMIAWTERLKKRGLKLGVLSNIGDAMEQGVLERCAWLGDFDHHTFSHRLGCGKPDAEIYAHAVEGLGVAAEEILFVDDRAENIAGARAAGMKAVQYTDHAAFVKAMDEAGLGGLLAE